MLKLSSLISKNDQQQQALEQDNSLMEAEFTQKLKVRPRPTCVCECACVSVRMRECAHACVHAFVCVGVSV